MNASLIIENLTQIDTVQRASQRTYFAYAFVLLAFCGLSILVVLLLPASTREQYEFVGTILAVFSGTLTPLPIKEYMEKRETRNIISVFLSRLRALSGTAGQDAEQQMFWSERAIEFIKNHWG
jgi:hypothetical protein